MFMYVRLITFSALEPIELICNRPVAMKETTGSEDDNGLKTTGKR